MKHNTEVRIPMNAARRRKFVEHRNRIERSLSDELSSVAMESAAIVIWDSCEECKWLNNYGMVEQIQPRYTGNFNYGEETFLRFIATFHLSDDDFMLFVMKFDVRTNFEDDGEDEDYGEEDAIKIKAALALLSGEVK